MGSASAGSGARRLPYVAGLVADTISGFFFWTWLNRCGDTIFFFPLVKLAVSGYEVFTLVVPAACAFGVGWTRRAVYRRFAFIPLADLTGLAAFFYPHENATYAQLLIVANINSLFYRLLGVAAAVWTPERGRRERAVLGLLAGLAAHQSLRLAWASFLPMWVRPGHNLAACGLSLLCALLYSREDLAPPDFAPEKEKAAFRARPWLATALGFGSAQALLLWLVSERGVIPRYVGADPLWGGLGVIAASALGGAFGRHPLSASRAWTWAGLLGALAMHYFRPTGHPGEAYPLPELSAGGGLLLAAWLASLLPRYADALAATNTPGRVLAVSGMLSTLTLVGSCWCVNYKFVPGGAYTRERGHWLILAMAALAALGYRNWVGKAAHRSQGAGSAGRALAVAAASLLLLAAPAAYSRLQFEASVEPPQFRTEDFGNATNEVATFLVWTIHFGYDNFGGFNLDEVAAAIRGEGRRRGPRELRAASGRGGPRRGAAAQVVGIIESDGMRPYSGNRDVIEYLAMVLGMKAHFGLSSGDHSLGCGIMSSLPLLRAAPHALPSPQGEVAPLVHATFAFAGRELDVFVTHFGNTEDTLDLKLQSEWFAEHAAPLKTFVGLGYFTTWPYMNHYLTLHRSGLHDAQQEVDYDRYCQYIWLKGGDPLEYRRVPAGRLSDTEYQVATVDFMAPEPEHALAVAPRSA
eukprot:tig00001254_g7814.t1